MIFKFQEDRWYSKSAKICAEGLDNFCRRHFGAVPSRDEPIDIEPVLDGEFFLTKTKIDARLVDGPLSIAIYLNFYKWLENQVGSKTFHLEITAVWT